MKFLVLKISDIDNALPDDVDYIHFWNLVHKIGYYRKAKGKPNNKYLVINQDEPYAAEVAAIMAKNGHIVEGV